MHWTLRLPELDIEKRKIKEPSVKAAQIDEEKSLGLLNLEPAQLNLEPHLKGIFEKALGRKK